MNKTTTLLIGAVLLGGVALAGCQQTPSRGGDGAMAGFATPAGGGEATYEQAVQDAKVAIAEADAVNGLWRDTGKILKQAEKAAEAGDYDKAVKLANEAEFQAEMGKEQAIREDNADNPAYLY